MYEPLWPCAPTTVTPVVYGVYPLLVPFDVVENLNGWEPFVESLWSKRYVFPDFNTKSGVSISSIKYLLLPSVPNATVTSKTVVKLFIVPLLIDILFSTNSFVGSLDVNVKSISESELEEPVVTVLDVIVIVGAIVSTVITRLSVPILLLGPILSEFISNSFPLVSSNVNSNVNKPLALLLAPRLGIV